MASASSARLEFVWVVRVDPISFLVDISIRKPQKISKKLVLWQALLDPMTSLARE